MRKLLLVLATTQLIFVMSSFSYGASDKCTVVGVEKNKLTLECRKKNGSFQVNDKIKIKSMKQKSVEGC